MVCGHSMHEINVFNLQAWDLTPKIWELAGIALLPVDFTHEGTEWVKYWVHPWITLNYHSGTQMANYIFTLTMLLKIFRYKKIYSPLNLNRLQFFVDSGRINPKEPINMYHLWRSGAIAGRIKDGVTLLGGVSSLSFFITISFTKPGYEGHKVWEKGLPSFCFKHKF